jgi:hypothetical protein
MTRTGTEIASTLPEHHTTEREELLFLACLQDLMPVTWVPVELTYDGFNGAGPSLRGTVWVARNALRVGVVGDSFRPTVSHPTAQRIADSLVGVAEAQAPDGVVLPTAKIMDAAAMQSGVVVAPCTQTPSSSMASTARMLEHSQCVDASLEGSTEIPNQEGKAWVNTVRLEGRPQRSANYGLYAKGAPYRGVLGVPLWQPGPGIKHISGIDAPGVPQGYTDYSQVCERFVKRTMYLENIGYVDIVDVALHPEWCWLVSTEGPLLLRHPGVPAAEDWSASCRDAWLDTRRAEQPANLATIPDISGSTAAGSTAAPEAEAEPPSTERPAPPSPLLTRTLRQGMTGTDVAMVQRIVGATADGIFGPKTKRAVMVWQSKNRDHRGRALAVDGIVGPLTREAMLRSLDEESTSTDGDIYDELYRKSPELLTSGGLIADGFDPHRASFKEARYYLRDKPRSVVHWIVIHSAEIGEFPTSAEALQNYAHRMPDGRIASWHWSIDNDSATKSVDEKYVAYHAKKANRFGVGYEHAGYARQTREDWLDDYSESMLWISAVIAARYTGPRWDLPLDNVVDAAGLRRAYDEFIDRGKPVPNELRGFTTHHAVTLGLGGSHVDPGRGFPMDRYLEMVHLAT